MPKIAPVRREIKPSGGTPSNINEIYTSMKSIFSGLQFSVADSTGLSPFV